MSFQWFSGHWIWISFQKVRSTNISSHYWYTYKEITEKLSFSSISCMCYYVTYVSRFGLSGPKIFGNNVAQLLIIPYAVYMSIASIFNSINITLWYYWPVVNQLYPIKYWDRHHELIRTSGAMFYQYWLRDSVHVSCMCMKIGRKNKSHENEQLVFYCVSSQFDQFGDWHGHWLFFCIVRLLALHKQSDSECGTCTFNQLRPHVMQLQLFVWWYCAQFRDSASYLINSSFNNWLLHFEFD